MLHVRSFWNLAWGYRSSCLIFIRLNCLTFFWILFFLRICNLLILSRLCCHDGISISTRRETLWHARSASTSRWPTSWRLTTWDKSPRSYKLLLLPVGIISFDFHLVICWDSSTQWDCRLLKVLLWLRLCLICLQGLNFFRSLRDEDFFTNISVKCVRIFFFFNCNHLLYSFLLL